MILDKSFRSVVELQISSDLLHIVSTIICDIETAQFVPKQSFSHNCIVTELVCTSFVHTNFVNLSSSPTDIWKNCLGK